MGVEMAAVSTVSQEILNPQLHIEGSASLNGVLRVSGAKNSALVLMTATLLCPEPVELCNVPDLTDIAGMAEILQSLGVRVQRDGDRMVLDASTLTSHEPPYELVNSLRASFFSIGSLLGRLGHAKVPLPGGCRIGARPVVEHIRGLKALGAHVTVEHGVVSASVPGTKKRLKGAPIVLDCPSVGATETILMAAVLAEGTTTIENAAQEPEVQDLANMLVAMGADISGAGGPLITIHGVDQLHSVSSAYPVIPDRIEAGTFLMAAAITRSSLRVEPVIADHLSSVLQKLRDCGCKLEIDDLGITITPGDIQAVDITTQPFPGFPTDLQAQMMALLTTAEGVSVLEERIFENRFMHAPELVRMGAQIDVQGGTATVTGVEHLRGAPVMATDLRASVSLILAGLAAEGETIVSRVYHLDRGYERVEEKLSAVGAKIERISGQ
mgnify:CR=1 FL=1